MIEIQRIILFKEAVIERGIDQDTLLSHFKIVNKMGSVRAAEYKTRKVAKDTFLSTDKILKFVKRHLKQELHRCEE